VALEARQDFFKLALEVLGSNGRRPSHARAGAVVAEPRR
jgi:hypothetical protein